MNALSAHRLKRNLQDAHKALGAIPDGSINPKRELFLNVYPLLLAMAEKIAEVENEVQEIGAVVADHDESLATLDIEPSVGVLKGLVEHLGNVAELIENVSSMMTVQIEAPGLAAEAKAELQTAYVRLTELGEANAGATVSVKKLIEEAEAEPDESEEGEGDEEGDEGEPEEGGGDDA